MTTSERSVTRDKEGEVVEYTITAGSGACLRLMSYGATLTSLRLPRQGGPPAEVTLCYQSAEGFLSSRNVPYFGVTVGRFGNRIRAGRFTLEGREYRLACNDGANHLHGGKRGFDKRYWRGERLAGEAQAGVRFSYRSPDGEEGYPGTLEVTVEYLFAEDATLTISYEALTDSPTVLNLTNHTYWNLGGAKTILDHTLELRASRYLEVDSGLLPTGRILSVEGTPFDFRAARRIGDRIGETGGGYDHCYVLDSASGTLAIAAVLGDPASGRSMEVLTTQPGVQFYSGNFLETAGFPLRGGMCLETQHYPDCVNQPRFPSAVLRPGERFRQSTVHRFPA